MRSKILTCISATILLAWLAAAVRLDAQEGHERTHYSVTNLGTLGGGSSSGNTINNLGWAMGSSNLPGNINEHAALWIYGLRFDLGTLGGQNSDVPWPVKNDRGQIAGIAETSAIDPLGEGWSCSAFFPTVTNHICVGFVWQFGEMTALPTLGGNNGFAAGMNNEGQVAGWAENTVHDSTCVPPQVLQFEPVLYGPGKGQIQKLPTFAGDPDGAATAVNDHGQVVGISGTCDVAVGAFTAKHALLWQDGKLINLGTLGGRGWNTPMAINNRGQIVGFSDLAGDVTRGVLAPNFHAFLWTKEKGMQDLGTLPGDTLSEALDINNEGQVVGVSYPSSHAFLWQNGMMKDLNKLVPSDSPLLLLAANGVNDRGEITGQACVIADGSCTAGNETPAFLATPNHDADDSATEGNERPNVSVPENIRAQVMGRITFGHFHSQPVRQ